MDIANVTAVAGAEKVSCHAGKSVECVFTVTNPSDTRARLSLEPRVKAPAKSGWFEVADEIERDLSAGGSDQVRVRVRIPEGTSAGKYTFCLRAYLTDDPEQFADSPMIAVEVPAATQPTPTPTPKPSGFRWWPFALAGVLVVIVVGGGVAYYLSRPEPGAPSLVWNEAKWGEAAWQ